MGKGEITHKEYFFLFPQCFSTSLENFLIFSLDLKFLSANFFSLEESKFCRLGKGIISIGQKMWPLECTQGTC